MHADHLFRRLFTLPQSSLHRVFRLRDYNNKKKKKGPRGQEEAKAPEGQEQEGETKKAVKLLGKQLFAANLTGVPFREALTWTKERWNQAYQSDRIRWTDVYDKYVVPLSRLTRAVHNAYTTREKDRQLLSLAREYTRGCREVLGEDFVATKGLWHRLFHVVLQAEGRRKI